MLLTNNIVKFNKLLVKIPRQTKRVWDLVKIDGDINSLEKKANLKCVKWWVNIPPFFFMFLISSK